MKEDIYRNLKFLWNAFLYNSPIIIIIIFLFSLFIIIEISTFLENGYIIIWYIVFSFYIWILAIQKKKKMKKEIKRIYWWKLSYSLKKYQIIEIIEIDKIWNHCIFQKILSILKS